LRRLLTSPKFPKELLSFQSLLITEIASREFELAPWNIIVALQLVENGDIVPQFGQEGSICTGGSHRRRRTVSNCVSNGTR
jgi:hypothetical protein